MDQVSTSAERVTKAEATVRAPVTDPVSATAIDGSSNGTIRTIGTKETRRILRNVCVLSIAFMVHFIAYKGAGNLQTTVHKAVGSWTLSAIYISLLLSNVFMPVVVIRRFGCKWVVALSFITYMPYMVAQFHPQYYTMIPAALFLGIGAAPMWCGKCVYLSVFAEQYSELTGISSEVLTVRFFGIFFMFFQFSQIFGNLISSLIFSKGTSDIDANTVDVRELCGAHFCTFTGGAIVNNTNLKRPSDEKLDLIAWIYLSCMAAAMFIVVFGVDSLKRYGEGKRQSSGTGLTGFKLLAITMKLNTEVNQILIIPITIFMGLGQAFVSGEFTKAFVGCAWGITYIGFVMICYGIFNSIAAFFSGWVVKLTGRLPLVSAAFVLQMCLLVAVLFWKPHPDERVVFFVIAAMWGVCDGVWLVQINALCGIMFPGREEAAYSNFRLWESLGFAVSHGYSMYICTAAKIYVVTTCLCLGMVGYVIIELSEIRKSKAKKLHAKN